STVLTASPFHSSGTRGVPPGSHPLKQNLETSLESPPAPPPSAGGASVDDGKRKTGEDPLQTRTGILPEPVAEAERSIVILASLTEQEWNDCQTGLHGFAAHIQRQRQSGEQPSVPQFHRWARNRNWIGFVTSGKQSQQRMSVLVDSKDG